VLNNLSEQIRDCFRHAEDCARKAAAQSDPVLREDLLQLEKSWLNLARSIEFTDQLTRFTKNRAKPNIKPSRK
jgi:hypothetical protein